MKQLSFFSNELSSAQSSEQSAFWKLYVDGAARNNPGPAGAGIAIVKNEKIVEKSGIFLGLKTNNQAEYFALLFGLYRIHTMSAKQDLLLVISDSQLLIRQLQGLYKVKEPHLKPLFMFAQSLLKHTNSELTHVLREENSDADEAANHAIDHKTQAPQDFLELLQQHEISL
jgi:ribonuclease HI